MISRSCFAILLFAMSSCSTYPSVVMRVESWGKVTRDGAPCLSAELAHDLGLAKLLADYDRRVCVLMGPLAGDPADCIIGRWGAAGRAGGPVFFFRLDALHQANKSVVLADRVALRLVVQWAYSYDVVATLDGLDPEQIGLRGVSQK